jgi:hypothetical protein
MATPSRREFVRAVAASGLAGSFLRAQPPKPDNPVKVPARAVTRGPKHHFFGYYDKTPWDKTGRYLLVMGSEFCDRQPGPKDAISLEMVDLKDPGEPVPISATTAWCWQQGCMLQWLGSAPDREVVFNAIDRGEPVAVVKDVHSGKSRLLPLPVYALSADGTQAVTLDFARLHRLRPGYGYASVKERFADDPAPDRRPARTTSSSP